MYCLSKVSTRVSISRYYSVCCRTPTADDIGGEAFRLQNRDHTFISAVLTNQSCISSPHPSSKFVTTDHFIADFSLPSPRYLNIGPDNPLMQVHFPTGVTSRLSRPYMSLMMNLEESLSVAPDPTRVSAELPQRSAVEYTWH